MRRMVAAVAVLALLAACGDTATDTTAAVTTPPTTAAATTTTAPVETTVLATTTTVAATTTVPAEEPTAEGRAAFALTQVVFGDSGYVAVTNVGAAGGDPGGHWICQRPLYFEIPSVALEPGQSVWLATGDGSELGTGSPLTAEVVGALLGYGRLDVASGEVALYRAASFGDPALIVDYVEWGEPGHGRAAVAIEAGIWAEGEFVEVPDGAVAISSPGTPGAGATAWAGDVGV